MILALLACRPYEPPPRPPALTRAQAHVFVRAEGAPRMVVRAGSAFDPPGREGLAWVAAHAVARGIGAEVDVGRELVEFSKVGRTVGVLDTAIPDRGCIDRGEDVFAARFWAGHPYGHPVWGRRSTLPTVDAGEVSRFVERWYVNPAVVVLGDTDADPGSPARLATAPTPTVRPSPPGGLVYTDGDSSCLVFGIAAAGPRSAEEWAIAARLREAMGDTRPLTPQVEPGFTVAVPLPDGVAGVERVRAEIDTLIAGGPSWATGKLSWGPAAAPLLGLSNFDGPFSDAQAALRGWLGGGRLQMVVVAPPAEYPPGTDVLSYMEITR